ncbi:MAG: DUF4398 domain-containing protein [Bdellovibrionales bacterium]|nr:DUF4398 domain-containing protein [Bdellovibrionales bacterium]
MTGKLDRKDKKRAWAWRPALFLLFCSIAASGLAGCSLFHDRPIQLMSDTAAALRAAKEVSADSLAPEKFRLANEAFFRAQNEYRLKNFAIAEKYAKRARRLAEESEFDALRQGSARTSLLPPDEPVGPPPPSTYEEPPGQLATEMMKQGSSAPQTNSGGSGASSGGSPSSNYPPGFSP